MTGLCALSDPSFCAINDPILRALNPQSPRVPNASSFSERLLLARPPGGRSSRARRTIDFLAECHLIGIHWWLTNRGQESWCVVFWLHDNVMFWQTRLAVQVQARRPRVLVCFFNRLKCLRNKSSLRDSGFCIQSCKGCGWQCWRGGGNGFLNESWSYPGCWSLRPWFDRWFFSSCWASERTGSRRQCQVLWNLMTFCLGDFMLRSATCCSSWFSF